MIRDLHKVQVHTTGFCRFRAYSDLIETYCCSAAPCYYVIFPDIGYEGYFHKSDVDAKEVEISDREQTNSPSKKQ